MRWDPGQHPPLNFPMAHFPRYPGDPGHPEHTEHTDPGDSSQFFEYNFNAYDFDDDKSAAPPPPAAEQPLFSFSNSCDSVSQFLALFADPNFNNNHDFAAPAPPLGLDPYHTPNWLVGHTSYYGPLGASEPSLSDLSQSIFFEPNSASHPVGPSMSTSLDPNDAEVLAAASALSRTTGMNSDMHFNLPPPSPGPSTTGPNTVAESGYHYQGHPTGGYMLGGSHSTPRHTSGFPGVLDGSRIGPQITHSPSRHVEAHYGSDKSFNQPQFQPRSHEDTVDDIDNRHLAILSCLTRNESAAPSRVPSPVKQGRFAPPNGLPAPFLQTRPDITRRQEMQHAEGPPPKRRKSSDIKVESPADRVAEGNMLGGPSPVAPTAEQHGGQPSAKATKTTKASTRPSKRKRASPRQPKRNLTDHERRNNHIISEARRRHQVIDAFGSLRELVPGIEKAKGLSRNAVLTAIGDWLCDLNAGNERLQSLLDGFPEEGSDS